MRLLTVWLCLALSGLTCKTTQAAEWSISSTRAKVGEPAVIEVSLRGDGESIIAELEFGFDSLRLELPVADGFIPGNGSDDGHCIRTAGNRVLARSSLDREQPLPSDAVVVCRIPFRVAQTALPGFAPLVPISTECVSEDATVEPCTANAGHLQVLGELPPSNEFVADRRYLALLLSPDPRAPRVEELSAYKFSGGESPPLAGLAVESPIRAYALLGVRASGDFEGQLERYPDTARSKLERYAVVEYPVDADLDRAISALRASPFVQAASELPKVILPGAGNDRLGPATVPLPTSPMARNKSSALQTHFEAMKVGTLWGHAGGWSLLGIIDVGLHVDHPDLRSFSGPSSLSGSYTGGNYLPAFAVDFGNLPSIDFNVDEAQPVPNAPIPPAPFIFQCDPDNNGQMVPTYAGHGTHVASLAAGNTSNPDGLDGICRHCGVAMMKMTRHSCDIDETLGEGGGSSVFSVSTDPAAEAGFAAAAQIGSQVISMSFGLGVAPHASYCTLTTGGVPNANLPACLMLQFAAENDILITAASGNFLGEIFFPGSDPRVAAAGGLNEQLDFWDDRIDPPTIAGCPDFPNSSSNCGSNYSVAGPTGPRQELVVQARNVLSSIYPGKNWSVQFGCGDQFGTYPGATTTDGIGLCTGTSMSAPQLAGLYGVLRSINPLVPAGDPENSAVYGIRDVVVDTTNRAQSGIGWDEKLGYGMPDAPVAAQKMLGTVRGETAHNRTTPLFAIYSPGATDYATVANPQAANALIRYQAASYASTGSFISGQSISGYSQFPLLGSGGGQHPARARAHVMTTEHSRESGLPPIIPLYLLDRERPWPLGCSAKSPPCNTLNRDFALASSVAELEVAVSQGYALKGRQGYIYARCSPEPTCIPPAAEALYQQCKTTDDDCAVFLERERTTFEAAGYLALPSFSSNSVIGYAYSNDDSDSDGLVDGMEYVVGLNPFAVNSDGDAWADAVEYPLAAVPTNDPCDGPTITCLVQVPLIFRNGFQ
ncbi:MAG: S8 family serine peptidase [Pseudomarimonas sp.]